MNNWHSLINSFLFLTTLVSHPPLLGDIIKVHDNGNTERTLDKAQQTNKQTNNRVIEQELCPSLSTNILFIPCYTYLPFPNRGWLVEGLIVARLYIWYFPLQLCRDPVGVPPLLSRHQAKLQLCITLWLISIHHRLYCRSVDEGSPENPLSSTRPQGFLRPHSRQSSVDSSKFTKRKPVNSTLSATPTVGAAATSSTASLPYPGTNNISSVSLSIGMDTVLPHPFSIHIAMVNWTNFCVVFWHGHAWEQRLNLSPLSFLCYLHHWVVNDCKPCWHQLYSCIAEKSTGDYWRHEPIWRTCSVIPSLRTTATTTTATDHEQEAISEWSKVDSVSYWSYRFSHHRHPFAHITHVDCNDRWATRK